MLFSPVSPSKLIELYQEDIGSHLIMAHWTCYLIAWLLCYCFAYKNHNNSESIQLASLIFFLLERKENKHVSVQWAAVCHVAELYDCRLGVFSLCQKNFARIRKTSRCTTSYSAFSSCSFCSQLPSSTYLLDFTADSREGSACVHSHAQGDSLSRSLWLLKAAISGQLQSV